MSCSQTGADAERTESLRWTVRPLQKHPFRVLLIFVMATAGFALGLLMFGHVLMGILGFAMIVGSTMDYWLGASYRLDQRGARSRVGLSVSEMLWEDVKRVDVSGGSIKLSPFTKPAPLETFRGVTLKTTPSNRDKVVDFVITHSPPPQQLNDLTT